MSRLAERLEELEASSLRRQLACPQGIDLSSNDYLGLARHPRVRDALQVALAQGVPHGSTGSRLLSGQHAAWDELEQRFAAWQGSESALFHATGFAANTGLIAAITEPGDRVISDKLNHASLIDGCRLARGVARLIVPHLDLDLLQHHISTPHRGTTWVVVESVYSMDGDRAPLAELATLCDRYGAKLIVDEAHATGLFGKDGAGCIQETDTREAIFASVHTCGKALGGSGAFVCGSRDLTDWLIQRSRPFVFSTAPAPFLAAGLHAAIDLVQSDEDLRARPGVLGRRLEALLQPGFRSAQSHTHIVPLTVGGAEAALDLQAHLARCGWHARAIRPPTVPDQTSRVRLVMRADLHDDDIQRLARDLTAW